MFTNEDKEKYPIRPEWEYHYYVLEAIRQSGICNMWGAEDYLMDWIREDDGVELSREDARKILLSWMANYEELNKKYKWRKL